jgi:hypothetical protein
MSLVLKALRQTTGLVTYALRIFVLSHGIIDVVFGLALASLCFYIAYDGSLVRGLLAGLVALVLSVVLGLFASVKITAFYALSRTIEQAAVGGRVFDALAEHWLGVSDENPRGDTTITQTLHGLTVEEAESKLNEAVESLLGHEAIERSVPRLVRWIADKIQRVLIGTVVRIVRRQLQLDAEGTVDLVAVRSQLADRIDEMIADQLRQELNRFLLMAAAVVVILSCLIAWGIRQLPL